MKNASYSVFVKYNPEKLKQAKKERSPKAKIIIPILFRLWKLNLKKNGKSKLIKAMYRTFSAQIADEHPHLLGAENDEIALNS